MALSEEQKTSLAEGTALFGWSTHDEAQATLEKVVEDMLRQERYKALEEAAQLLLDRRACGGTAYNAAARDVRGLKGI